MSVATALRRAARAAGRGVGRARLRRPRRRRAGSRTTKAPATHPATGRSCSGTSSASSASTHPKPGPTSPPTAPPAGRGVIVAVLDTGVAYANRGPFRRSPDFSRYTFVKGYDFVAKDPYPNDRNGHGTFVAGDDRRGDQQPLRPHRPGLRRPHHARAGARQPGRRRSVDDRRRRALRRQATTPR